MRRFRGLRAVAVGAAVLATALAGCTGGSPPPTPTGAVPTSNGTAPTGSGGSTSPAGVSPLGAKWDMSRLTTFDPYLESLRGTTTFTELVWCDVEKTQGNRVWRQPDQVARAASEHGITLNIKIRVGACWATGGAGQIVRGGGNKTESAMPTDLGLYRSFVHDVVQRYAAMGVHTYAVENEVNSESFWAGTPQELTTLTETAAKEIRATDPSARVADAGMSSTSYGYGISNRLLAQGKAQEAVKAWNTYFARRIGTRGEQIPQVSSEAELRTVLAGDQARRNLTYLDLAAGLAQRKVTDIRQVHFYEPWDAVPLLVDYLRATTPAGHPIEAWEVGSFWKGAAASEQVRAEAMTRTVALLLGGGVGRVIWLPLATATDNRHGEEVRYGLLDPDGTVRTAGLIMRDLVAASRGARVTAVARGDLHGVAMTVGGRSTMVLWSAGGPVTVTVGQGATSATPGTSPSAVSGARLTVPTSPVIVTTREPLDSVLASV